MKKKKENRAAPIVNSWGWADRWKWDFLISPHSFLVYWRQPWAPPIALPYHRQRKGSPTNVCIPLRIWSEYTTGGVALNQREGITSKDEHNRWSRTYRSRRRMGSRTDRCCCRELRVWEMNPPLREEATATLLLVVRQFISLKRLFS